MELLSLLAVNVVVCLILYVFFCLRINRVLRQKRNESVPPAFRENIEMTVSFINSSISLVDQRLKTCYQMLRRTEELLDKNSKKTSRVKAEDTSPPLSRKVRKNLHLQQKATGVSKNTKDKPKKSNLTRKELKSENIPASTSSSIPIPSKHKNQTQKDPVKPTYLADTPMKDNITEENHYQAEKVLDRLGVDRIEITASPKNAQEAYKTDSSKPVVPASEEGSTSPIESSPLSLAPDENLKIVRVLFKKGYKAEDIASFLQISPAEVHLIASLPDDGQKRPRRNRTDQKFAS